MMAAESNLAQQRAALAAVGPRLRIATNYGLLAVVQPVADVLHMHSYSYTPFLQNMMMPACCSEHPIDV